MFLNFTIQGRVPTKKNFLFRGKFGQMYRPPEVQDFEKSAYITLISQKGLYQDVQFPVLPQKVYLEFHQQYRKDLDNLIGAIFDSLQHSQIIHNDNDIYHIEAKKLKSKEEKVIINITIQ